MDQVQIAQNIALVREKIEHAAKKVGRDASEVTLIAVTKTVPPQTAALAVNAGIYDIGENRTSEYRLKRDFFPEQINTHFIGQLQRNKVKYIISDVAYIHSLDRLSLAEEISRRAGALGRRVNVLMEVAFDSDENRGGVRPEDLEALSFKVNEMPELNLCGLMCVAPLDSDEAKTRACFRELAAMRARLEQKGLTLPHLSMGMSGDYEIAVEEGATFVRVGTSIFGQRVYDNGAEGNT